MSNRVVAKEEIKVGTAVVIEGASTDDRYQAVFEDDGETGYFYAVDPMAEQNTIQDAVQIYNVRDVVDRDKPSIVEIVWSADNRKVVLLINNHPHAVFNFEAKRGFCRTGFPPPNSAGVWSVGGHGWTENALAPFR